MQKLNPCVTTGDALVSVAPKYFKPEEIPQLLHRRSKVPKQKRMGTEVLDLLRSGRRITLSEIRRAVEYRFKVRLNVMDQHPEFVLARQLAWHLAHTLTTQSTVRIGKELGQRHHTSVLHGLKKMARSLRTDERVVLDLIALRRDLGLRDGIPKQDGKVDINMNVPDESGIWI